MAEQRRTTASTPVTELDPIDSEELVPTFHNPGAGPTTSVLICDDRPAVGNELSQTFRRFLPSIAPVEAQLVADGFALVDAFETRPADLVLIGIHGSSNAGIDAINLLLGINPQANTVVYGSVADVELLAAAYARGAGGLLVWEPSGAAEPTHQQGFTTADCTGPNPRPTRSHRR